MKKPSIRYRMLKGLINFLISIVANIKVTGYDNFDKNKQYVIVGNHTGWMDPYWLSANYQRNIR